MSVLQIKDASGKWVSIPSVTGPSGKDYILTEEDKQEIAEMIPGGDASIDDTTPSTNTTYSSVKIDAIINEHLNSLNEDINNIIVESESEPKTESTGLWVKPGGKTFKIPQINDSAESEEDTWSSKKIASKLKEDKTGIVSDVLAALPTWEGGEY